jgi:NAD(P)-dependent dehydrogenase (short-subunit alcohol dehydrogenase family)
MCSYDSIQTFVERVKSELLRLDIAILNAGRLKDEFELVPSTGHKESLQVNYLSTILLATLLPPILKSKSPQGTPGRLSIVTSGTTLFTKLSNSQQSPLLKSFDDIMTAPAPGIETYGAAKLLCHMFIFKLVDYVSADDMVVNLVDPGMTRGTGLNRDVPKIRAVLVVPMLVPISRKVTDGASAYLDATGKKKGVSWVFHYGLGDPTVN